MKTTKSLRQEYVDIIMDKKYKDEDPFYDEYNYEFLDSLSLPELKSLADGEFCDELM